MDNSRPTWAEIDLTAIKHNLKTIRKAAGDAGVMAVVKANAYGHGVLEVSRACQEAGIDYFGVASLQEALELKESKLEAPVLVLGHIPEGYATAAIKAGVRTCIFTLDSAQAFSEAALALGSKARVHLKVDTGMGRLGFAVSEESLEQIIQISRLQGVELEGIFTHFAEADAEDESFTRQQLEQFAGLIGELDSRGVSIPIKHCANSAAVFRYPEAVFNLVRAGIVLYGLNPSPVVARQRFDLIPAMTLKSRISFVKVLPGGCPVSYGRTYYCQGETRVATVPIGYADGYSRLLSNRAWAVVRGQKVPLIGTVCMDQCMFDVSGVEGIQAGDEVILFGREEDGVTADDLAAIIGTINYEVICSLSPRVARTFKG
ncbi:alanine racemase [Syntrophomonas palmitatica]|uniref:alanine racemase n=1 Tax=Syntrophomonas palmitatica TaxID=402877 RepID=UPI0006CFF538|nr:alanine racemase [Syntrophomonas palmitatica]